MTSANRLAIALPAILGALAAAGCGGGSSIPSGTRVSGSGVSGGGSGPAITIREAPGLPATFPVKANAKNVSINAFSVEASGADVLVRSVVLHASGTADDAAAVDGVHLAIDDGDGKYDPARDQAIGGIARYSADDGTAILGGLQHVAKAGSPELWWVVYDLSGKGQPAETVKADVLAAADVDAADAASGRPVQVLDLPTSAPAGVLFLGEHLMLSEICVTPTNGEFIEIYNPTARPIDLSDVYLSDAEDWKSTPEQHYWNLPTGRNYGLDGPQRSSDFVVRFPAGATIQPGQFVTIAFDSDRFRGQYGKNPDFEMTRDGTGDGVADMRLPPGAPVPASTTSTAGLANDRELVILFQWDGQSDTVQDLDIVEWGDDLSGFYVDKTGIEVDGPDQDTRPTPYRNDQPFIMHDKAAPNAIGSSMKRIDFSEWGENPTGGNGVTGHDETSENWATTWSNLTPPTPGSK
jgi:hypothetical protein